EEPDRLVERATDLHLQRHLSMVAGLPLWLGTEQQQLESRCARAGRHLGEKGGQLALLGKPRLGLSKGTSGVVDGSLGACQRCCPRARRPKRDPPLGQPGAPLDHLSPPLASEPAPVEQRRRGDGREKRQGHATRRYPCLDPHLSSPIWVSPILPDTT